jgi:hypothetical protein
MSVQRLKAESMNLEFRAIFTNINILGGFSPFIVSDRERIMQVLLGL